MEDGLPSLRRHACSLYLAVPCSMNADSVFRASRAATRLLVGGVAVHDVVREGMRACARVVKRVTESRAGRLATRTRGRLATIGTLMIALAMGFEPAVGLAQTNRASGAAPGAFEGTGFFQVFGRLDGRAIALIAAAAAIVVLLLFRIGAMVRGERRSARPIAVPPERKARSEGAPFEHSTLRTPTDWGHDQNNRSAQGRQTVKVTTTKIELPSLADAITQWTISDVQNAAEISKQPADGLGKPANPPQSPYQTAFNPYFRGEPPGSEIEVIEVADTLLQAELLVQLGDPKHAMTLLSNHIRTHERPGPAIWLMLLNLYQTTGRKSQYEALSKGFSTLFNAMVPEWSASPESVARDLESYPQVMAGSMPRGAGRERGPTSRACSRRSRRQPAGLFAHRIPRTAVPAGDRQPARSDRGRRRRTREHPAQARPGGLSARRRSAFSVESVFPTQARTQ